MAADVTKVTTACAINWQGGREKEYGDEALNKNGDGRVVAVIGGGPAGLEAGIVLAKRGFKPVIFEKNAELGGQLLLASKPPKKEKMLWLLEYQTAMLKKLGVEIKLSHAPSLEELKALNPYAVLVAQGSLPVLPGSIEGIHGDNVYTAPQILSGEVSLAGKKVAVIGSGMTGLETAEYLAARGNAVSVFELQKDIGPGLFFQVLIDVMSRLGEHQPEIHPLHRLTKISGGKAYFDNEGVIKEYEADAFVVSLGVAPNTELVDAIRASFPNTLVIGDALAGGRLEPAIGGGYKAAFSL
jgi:NADPH-dependent 2,4-dienoyl-CoA reductase/sulfur reductase-like enzyme